MSQRELVEWQLLEAIEPFGAARTDWMIALLIAHLKNLHLAHGQPAYQPDDFMPLFTSGPLRPRTTARTRRAKGIDAMIRSAFRKAKP